MASNIANDRDFEDAFARAYVSKTKLARYYLGMLERTASGKDLPELVPNDDTTAVNLEHILPLNSRDTDTTDFGESSDYTSRIGNLVLLNAKLNSAAGNGDFQSKRIILENSPFLLTKEVAKFDRWGIAEIDERQIRLAKLAVKTWSTNIA
jgi:hypothetical protein